MSQLGQRRMWRDVLPMYRHPDEMSALIQPSYLHHDSKGVRRPTRQLLSPISVRICVGM